MKVIFLDIDGVLNSFEKHADITLPHSEWCPETMNAFGITLDVFPEMVARVNKITSETGAKLVLSSSWRVGYLADYADVIIHLHNSGLNGFIVGRTPHDTTLNTRGKEIVKWFKEHSDEKIESFIILDDNDNMDPVTDRLVHTDHQTGIQDADVDKAIAMLDEPTYPVFIGSHISFVKGKKDDGEQAG